MSHHPFSIAQSYMMLEAAENFMRQGQPGEALREYQEAWSQLSRQLDKTQQVWLLLALANAAVRAGDFAEAYDPLAALPQYYAESGVVVGNPLFHLLVGLSLYGLQDDPDGATDNFARALICGGQEIFVGEDPIHLTQMKSLLLPPSELGTWDGYVGCSVDLLNGATGYMGELLTAKYGRPAPYPPRLQQ